MKIISNTYDLYIINNEPVVISPILKKRVLLIDVIYDTEIRMTHLLWDAFSNRLVTSAMPKTSIIVRSDTVVFP